MPQLSAVDAAPCTCAELLERVRQLQALVGDQPATRGIARALQCLVAAEQWLIREANNEGGQRA